MSTFDVLKRAAATGKNLVITHEPTFWTGNDNLTGLDDDPLLAANRNSSRRAGWRYSGFTTTGTPGGRSQ